MTSTKITTHTVDALARRMQQYKESPNLEALITIFTDRTQTIENAFDDLDLLRWLDTATGEQIDALGRTLDVARGGYADAAYVLRIKAAIVRYHSSGRWAQVAAAMTLLTGATTIQMDDSYPANVQAILIGSIAPVASYADILVGIRAALAAGVGITSIVLVSPTPLVFFGDPLPAGQGFGTLTDALIGGNFATIMV